MPWLARGGGRTPDAPNSPHRICRIAGNPHRCVLRVQGYHWCRIHLSVLPLSKSHCDLDCTFSLNNRDVIKLSALLPRLERLCFGFPCSNSSHDATVSCLLALSARCKNLWALWIHFNTKLVDDIRFYRRIQSCAPCVNFRRDVAWSFSALAACRFST